MRGFILVSHGMYAMEMKNSLKMITGDISNVFDACLLPDEGLDQFKEKLTALKKEIEKYDEVIVFVDLMGGTPCNAAISVFMEEQRVSVIAGMNFPMVLAALLEEEMTTEELISGGKDGIVNVKAIKQSMSFEEEEE